MNDHIQPEDQTPCKPCEFSSQLGKTVLNSLSAQIAIISETGIILETNKAWLEFAQLSGAHLFQANLTGARLCRSHLSIQGWTGAVATDLREATLIDADLSYADLRGAQLQGANLKGADLTGTKLQGACLTDAIMPDGTPFRS